MVLTETPKALGSALIVKKQGEKNEVQRWNSWGCFLLAGEAKTSCTI